MTALLEPLDCECDEEEEFEPRLYRDLPPEIQKLAVKEWRNNDDYDCDTEFITESLEELLDYEFGIQVHQRTQRCRNGKTYDEPKLYWGTYRHEISFHADLDIDKLLSHGVPDCEYFSENAAELLTLWNMKDLLDAVRLDGYEPEWIIKMDEDDRSIECNYYGCDLTTEQQEVYDSLADRMTESLKSIYKDACERIYESVNAEIDYHNSDEYIIDRLDNGDYKFNEEGEIV